MGCDIHGWVEIKEYQWTNYWSTAISVSAIVGRNYDMFALLFGVRNDAHFVPVAEDRGIPDDATDIVKGDFAHWGMDGHSPSYITWQEIQQIDWQAYGTQEADRIFCYRPGETEHYMSFGVSSELTREDYAALDRGETIEGKDMFTGQPVLYRRGVQQVSDALSGDWEFLFSLMRALDAYVRRGDRQEEHIVESRALPAHTSDDSRVRLVVWFDN